MKRLSLAALLGSAVAICTPAAGQEILAFGTANPEQHPLVTRILTPWVEAINADAGDLFQIEMRNGPMMVNHTNFYDRVQDDVVQLVWGVTAFDPGRFPHTLVSTLPFLIQNSETAAVAACEMARAGNFGSDFDGLVPLLFVQFPQAALSFNNHPATGMESMAGMKVMTGSPVVSGLVQAYGGTPLSINVPEMYQALQRGTAEGMIMNFTAFPGFRLNEVTTDHLIAPLGGAVGVVFMMQDRYDALPAEARAVLDAHSDCAASRTVGAETDRWEADARAFVEAQGGHTFNTLNDEQLAELTARVSGTIQAGFIARVGEGGEELIAQYRAALDAAAAE